MTSQSNQSAYIMGVLCITLILISGFVTSLRIPTLDSTCVVLQRKETRKACCVEDCSPNCDADCKSRGFPIGGSCDPRTGNELCCCFME
ncbi:LCR [Medicago truncatula]|uniref:LCR n=1 Tax=Medicago truncatula TaxID=3880 RepID=A0A072UUX9_MEDTR|nr:LCR [Medicago truncatula]